MHKSIDSHFIFPRKKHFDATEENTAVVSVINEDFVDYFVIFANSIKEHNNWFNFKWIIFYSEQVSPLSDKSKERIRSAYANVIFKCVDDKIYERFKNLTPPHLFPSLFKIELFNLKNINKVICLDIDTLCMGDLKFLFDNDITLAVSTGGNNYNGKIGIRNVFKRRISFNAGVMVIGNKLINEKVYNDLLKYNKFAEFAEQSILNEYFRFYPKYVLPFEYNFNALVFSKYIDLHQVKILHYCGPKPDKQPELPQMKYWLDAREKYIKQIIRK